MKSRYDFQTEQIHRQHEHVMNAFAARQMRDQSIKISYEAGHIDYETYKQKIADSRKEMFRQEYISCLNFRIAMMQFDVDMYTTHPESYVAPKE